MTGHDHHQRAFSGSAPRIGPHRDQVSSDTVDPRADTLRSNDRSSDDRKGVAPR